MWYAASLQGVQKTLLTKADLIFAKVLETAEIAERETKDAQNSCRVSQNRKYMYIKWQHHQEGGDRQA